MPGCANVRNLARNFEVLVHVRACIAEEWLQVSFIHVATYTEYPIRLMYIGSQLSQPPIVTYSYTLSVEFLDDDTESTTTWYQGTVIAYKPRQGHIVSFDGCGPEENEVIKSLKKALEKGEIRLL